MKQIHGAGGVPAIPLPHLANGNSRPASRDLWGSGDYQAIAANFVIIAETLCESAELRAGQRVLDIATGTGNAAIAAARRGCRVTGVDFTTCLLERGAERAKAEGLQVTFAGGDAQRLPFADGGFDVVLSTLGVMFAADQQAACDELLRVCRPGGKIALASWTPDGSGALFSKILAKYLPPSPEGHAPFRWGTEEGLMQMIGGSAKLVSVQRRSYKERDLSAAHSWASFQNRCGFALHLMQSLTDQVRAKISDEVVAAVERLNCSGDDTLLLPHDYLEVVAVKNPSAP